MSGIIMEITGGHFTYAQYVMNSTSRMMTNRPHYQKMAVWDRLRSKAMDNIPFTAWFIAFAMIPIAWVIVSHHLQKANSKRIYREFNNE